MISVIYLTRKCPNTCDYCSIRNSPLQGNELTTEQWKIAFDILANMGTEFFLILGNEPLARSDIVILIDYLTNTLKIPYGLYTTFPDVYIKTHARNLIDTGITNVSCGIDVLPKDNAAPTYMREKARRGLRWLKWFRLNGVQDLHASITVSKANIHYLGDLARLLTKEKIWAGFNPLHWNKDGYYDFSPIKKYIETLVLSRQEIEMGIGKLIKAKQVESLMVHNPDKFLYDWMEYGENLTWHCSAPEIITVDADGTMRCCGYRKGEKCSTKSIFKIDLDTYWNDWKIDMKKCPGCYWSCPWQAEHWSTNIQNIQYHKEINE